MYVDRIRGWLREGRSSFLITPTIMSSTLNTKIFFSWLLFSIAIFFNINLPSNSLCFFLFFFFSFILNRILLVLTILILVINMFNSRYLLNQTLYFVLELLIAQVFFVIIFIYSVVLLIFNVSTNYWGYLTVLFITAVQSLTQE